MEARFLYFTVHSASNLIDVRKLGEMKVYAKVSIAGKSKCTKPDLVNNINPEWNKTLEFIVPEMNIIEAQASAVGKPIAIDKATQIKSRPSTVRVNVILDLMEKLPNRIRLQFVDGKFGKLIENRVNSMDVDTRTIGVQTTTENKGDCNNQEVATNEVQSKEVGLNLMSNATKNTGGTPRVGVDAPRVDSGQKILNTSDVEDAENSGQHVLQVENENPTKNWILVAHKKSTSSRSLSPTSQNNSPCSEKGPAGNFHDSEKRQDTSLS
ncbi:hypothetical protein MTR67_000110 [Solanum verrucosum]|uniref:C2 domain-containing protein n=1 Tax=Solanum verrucosum TaxID=315347 RepID=A0AAF0PN21_SOLVR|nr:hypothetical protein MTR67_000110 [Solanum verrucosum]